jgi:hypothetical protein
MKQPENSAAPESDDIHVLTVASQDSRNASRNVSKAAPTFSTNTQLYVTVESVLSAKSGVDSDVLESYENIKKTVLLKDKDSCDEAHPSVVQAPQIRDLNAADKAKFLRAPIQKHIAAMVLVNNKLLEACPAPLLANVKAHPQYTEAEKRIGFTLDPCVLVKIIHDSLFRGQSHTTIARDKLDTFVKIKQKPDESEQEYAKRFKDEFDATGSFVSGPQSVFFAESLKSYHRQLAEYDVKNSSGDVTAIKVLEIDTLPIMFTMSLKNGDKAVEDVKIDIQKKFQEGIASRRKLEIDKCLPSSLDAIVDAIARRRVLLKNVGHLPSLPKANQHESSPNNVKALAALSNKFDELKKQVTGIKRKSEEQRGSPAHAPSSQGGAGTTGRSKCVLCNGDHFVFASSKFGTPGCSYFYAMKNYPIFQGMVGKAGDTSFRCSLEDVKSNAEALMALWKSGNFQLQSASLPRAGLPTSR